MYAIALSVLLAAIAPGSGKELCNALTNADFTKVGIAVNKTPTANIDDPASAYCTYKGKSGAMGGVELDVFYPTDAEGTERTAMGEGGSNYVDAHVSGVDDSRVDLTAVSGGPPFATLVVRKKNLVYVLSIPASPRAGDQLRALSKIVLQRLMP
jgi:hypothetical protein